MRGKVTLIVFIAVLVLVMSAALSFAGMTELISHVSSRNHAISGDGRYVAYVAAYGKIFVRDRSTWDFTRMDIGYDGNPANKGSGGPAFSCDGRYIAFNSLATNLVPGDNNGRNDIFVRDMQTGKNVIVSVTSSGQQGNNGGDSGVDISCDGRFVVFASRSSNLVTGDTNGQSDVFVHDRDADENGIFDEPGGISTERVSVSSDGTQGNGTSTGNSISDDGKYVVFTSNATNLVDDDTNGEADAFVHNRQTGETKLVSLDENGNQLTWYPPYVQGISGATPVIISGDGRYVGFRWFYNHTMYVYDRETDTSLNLGSDYTPSAFNPDGRFLAYDCGWQVCLRDMQQGTAEVVSLDHNGNIGGQYSWYSGGMSNDGRYVAFTSRAKLVPEDTNLNYDIYVRDRGPQNAAPTANAGADMTVECGDVVSLDGSGSTDPDGDELTYTWTGSFGTATGVNATVTLPLGTHTVTLTVDDGNSGTATDDVVITIADTTPPVITIFGVSDGETYTFGLVPEASYDVMDTCSGVASSNALLVGGGDVCFDSFTYKVTATDNAGNEGTETATYEVIATADGLIALIHQMVLDGLIAPEMENSLVSKLQNGAFKAFINQVEAQTRSDGKNNKKIDPAAAAMLINAGSCL